MKLAAPLKYMEPHAFCRCLAGTLLLLFSPLLATQGTARELARLQGVEISRQPSSTRLDLKFDRETTYTLAQSGGRFRLTFKDADGPLFRKLHSYSDSHISGIRLSQRGNALQMVIDARGAAPSLRIMDTAAGILTINVGKAGRRAEPVIVPGREPILKGVARLITDFDPPLKAVIPFVPTDPVQLHRVVSVEEMRFFQRGESFLYGERGAEAAEIFAWYMDREMPLRPLACYRYGEALYLLGRYDEALRAFREGERRWPGYLALNSATTFYFADTIARTGDIEGGRRMLVRLIAHLAEKTYAPLLLDRLADILARNGREKEAVAIFGTVAEFFHESDAATHARLKLADRRLFSLTADTYRPLAEQYRAIHRAAGYVSMRDDACFKGALIESLYGRADKALAAIIQYEKQYPQGIFITIARSMRQELLLLVYREMYAAGDYVGLINLAQENRDYLGRCFADELFIRHLAEAFSVTGRPSAKVELFNQLADRDWTVAMAPFIYGEIVDTSMAMGDLAMADLTAANFLRRFPGHPGCRLMLEHRGEIAFLKKDLPGVVAQLSWLMKPREKAARSTSYYYLGKALTDQKEFKKAEPVLTRYVDELARSRVSSPLVGDAFFTLGTARRGTGDYRGAMAAYGAGLLQAAGGMKEQFLFAMGETALQTKNYAEAGDHWNRLLKEGNDPVWRRMAEQGLSDLEWKEKMKELSRPVK